MYKLVLLFLAICLFSQNNSFAQKKSKKNQETIPNPFVDQVKEHFEEWDTNNDGKLSIAEVKFLLSKNRIHGNQAAAICTLKHYFRNQEGSVSRQELINLGSWKPTGKKGEYTGGELLNVFNGFSEKTTNLNRKLFSQNPSPVGCHQGFLGDCYLISTLGAMANTNPNKIRKMIKENPDGTYNVQFPDGKSVHLPSLSDMELIGGASSNGQGCWLRVLEIAYGKRKTREKISQTNNLKDDKGKKDFDKEIGHGGSQEEAIKIFTGKGAQTVIIKNQNSIKGLLEKCHERITLCGILNDKKVPPGIFSGHGYAILDLDKAGKRVKVWNPHGNDFKTNGTEGLKNGYSTTKGVFYVSIADFLMLFDVVVFEKTHGS